VIWPCAIARVRRSKTGAPRIQKDRLAAVFPNSDGRCRLRDAYWEPVSRLAVACKGKAREPKQHHRPGRRFGSLKVERLHAMHFVTRRQAKDEVIDWLRFYNHRRLHSTLGYLSPMAFEKKWLGDQKRIAA
jgi:transposase InsO family protein